MSNLIGCDAILVGGGGGGSSEVIYARPQHCIQTISYATGDAKDNAANLYRATQTGQLNGLDYSAATPINTLKYNDPEFNAKVRFTNDSGTDIYGDDTERIRYDNLQGVIFDTTDFFNDNRRSLADAVANAATISRTLNGKTYATWYVCPLEFIINVIDEQWTTTEVRLFNTLGSGVLVQTNTFNFDGTRRYFIQNSTTVPTIVAQTTSNFNPIYIAFIEDGV